jgi:metal-responsive CopG/Arc/MetJ family transcriptional regulator
MEKKLASITIFTTNRQGNSKELNQLLTDYGHHIMSRLGVNVQRQCTSNCPGLIILAVEAEGSIINELCDKLNQIGEIKAEKVIL